MYDRRYLYLTWGGPLATVESWQTGLHIAHPEGGGGDHNVTINEWGALENDATLHADIDLLLKTWFQSGNNNAAIGALSKLSWFKLSYHDLGGEYISDPPIMGNIGPYSPPVTTPQAPQVSYVVSLRSGLTLGDANYGRMYCPPPSWLVGQNNGVATIAEAIGARVAMKGLIQGLVARIGQDAPGVKACIMSKKGIGTTKQVTQIGVGRVLDTQRRRRRSLDEDLTLEAI
jgi:hypothetical protein